MVNLLYVSYRYKYLGVEDNVRFFTTIYNHYFIGKKKMIQWLLKQTIKSVTSFKDFIVV